MCLKSCDRLRPSGLSNCLDSLSDADTNWDEIHVVVDREQISWVHGRRQEVQQEVVFVKENVLEIQGCVHEREQAGQRRSVHQEPIRVNWVERHETFRHAVQALRNSYGKQMVWFLKRE